MESLKSMHQQILHNVEMVQDRSSKILQEQEKDLLRAFRARLFDVQVHQHGAIIDGWGAPFDGVSPTSMRRVDYCTLPNPGLMLQC